MVIERFSDSEQENGMFKKWQASAERSCKSALYRGMATLPVAATLLMLGSPAHARTTELLTSFDAQPVVSKEELAQLRGGFSLGNGMVVNFGLQIQQFVNDMTKPLNDVNIQLVHNNFTVTQTTGGKTTTSMLTSLPQTFVPAGVVNNGATQLAVTISTQAIQSIVQNSANNQALTSVATLNVSTQGVMTALQHAAGTNQLIQTMQMNSWTHR
jgi:hypothetical protein